MRPFFQRPVILVYVEIPEYLWAGAVAAQEHFRISAALQPGWFPSIGAANYLSLHTPAATFAQSNGLKRTAARPGATARSSR